MAGDGAVVILGREPDNIVWWELEQLSRMTGWPLVGIDDLAQGDDGHLVLRDGGSPVDVVWRRTNENRLRGDDRRLTALGSMLIEPLRSGAVRVSTPSAPASQTTSARTSTSTGSCASTAVRSRCCAPSPRGTSPVDEQRAEALERLDELVFKPRDGAGGEGIVLGSRAALSKLRAGIDADPSAWVAQEPVALSTHPTAVDGRLEPRHVDLRPFVVGGRVLPGGLSRFAQRAGELVVKPRAARRRQGRVGAAGLTCRAL